MSEQIMKLNLIGNTSLPLSSFLSPPSVPSFFPIYNIIFISLPFPHPGCQARVCCHGIEWYSKDLKVDSGSRHLHSCCCCYHWYPTYHIWLLLPCTAGEHLCCHGMQQITMASSENKEFISCRNYAMLHSNSHITCNKLQTIPRISFHTHTHTHRPIYLA